MYLLLQERVTSLSAGACLCVFMDVCVCRSLLGGSVSVALVLSLGSLAGEPCYYQSSVTHRHDQKCIRRHSSFQVFILIEL